MAREPAEPLRLGYLIRAGAVHSITGETFRSVGLRGPEIVAVSQDADGLDDLAGSATRVVDAGDLTVLPAFVDSHLWNMASEMLIAWGPERTAEVNPLDQWLAIGADLAAGTDIVRPFNPMTAVWGMATRGTKTAGIQGREHAIDVATALRLYTMDTASLNHEQDKLGSITPGKLADLVAYPLDPLTADADVLPDLLPAFTVVGGTPKYDPDHRLTR